MACLVDCFRDAFLFGLRFATGEEAGLLHFLHRTSIFGFALRLSRLDLRLGFGIILALPGFHSILLYRFFYIWCRY